MVYLQGATVRCGVEIESSAVVRVLQYGDLVEAFATARTSEGILRYQIADGWISERLRGGNENLVLRIMREIPSSPLMFEIMREGGAKLRSGYSLLSEERGLCPFKTVITVTERRLLTVLSEGMEGVEDCYRLRLDEPSQYAGWISQLSHIVRPLLGTGETTGQGQGQSGSTNNTSSASGLSAGNSTQSDLSSSKIDSDIAAELFRRSEVRAFRKQLHTKPNHQSSPPQRMVKLSGSLDVSSETFFLLNGK